MSNINYSGVIRQFYEFHVNKITSEMKSEAKSTAFEGAGLVKRYVASRGIRKPGRIETGAMYDSAKSEVESESADHITVSFGFKDTPYYTVYQEDGTSQVKAMYALRDAGEESAEKLKNALRKML